MGKAKAQVSDSESPQTNAKPQDAVREHRPLQRQEAPALLERRPQMRQIFYDEVDTDRIEERPQTRPGNPIHEGGDEEAHEDEE